MLNLIKFALRCVFILNILSITNYSYCHQLPIYQQPAYHKATALFITRPTVNTALNYLKSQNPSTSVIIDLISAITLQRTISPTEAGKGVLAEALEFLKEQQKQFLVIRQDPGASYKTIIYNINNYFKINLTKDAIYQEYLLKEKGNNQ